MYYYFTILNSFLVLESKAKDNLIMLSIYLVASMLIAVLFVYSILEFCLGVWVSCGSSLFTVASHQFLSVVRYRPVRFCLQLKRRTDYFNVKQCFKTSFKSNILAFLSGFIFYVIVEHDQVYI